MGCLDLSSGQILKMDLCKVILFLALLGISCGAESKSPCQGCKDLVDGILKGLDKTKNKNFGGGDTAWEEKKNLKYKTSETRLVEILEGACAKDNFKCNEIASEREDDIETWYKSLQDSKPLQDYLCVEKAEVCCKEGKFGENCENDFQPTQMVISALVGENVRVAATSREQALVSAMRATAAICATSAGH